MHRRYEKQGNHRPVNYWNAVDVVGKEGMLQHGTVISADPDGLLIDFGCKTQRRVVVPYGAAFSYSQRFDLMDATEGPRPEELRAGRGVNVLLRVEAQGPWLWRPAALLTPRFPDGWRGPWVYVEVHLGGTVRRELVHWRQVRLPPSIVELQAHIVNKDDFLIWSVRPPPPHLMELSANSSQLEIFCRSFAYNASLISMSSTELLLLVRSDSYPRCQAEVESLLWSAYEYVRRSTWNGQIVRDQERQGCVPFQHNWVPQSVEASEWGLQRLCHDLMREAFTNLNTIEKTICRRVNRTFNALISQVVSETIWITCHDCCTQSCDDCTGYRSSYQLAASLLKCFTSRTRVVILALGFLFTQSDLISFSQQCGELMVSDARDPVLLVVFRCEIGREDYGFCHQAEEIAESLSIGHFSKLLLHRCIILAFEPELRFSGTLTVDCGNADLYQLMESQVPTVDVQRAAEWAAQAMCLPLIDRTHIFRVLNRITESDPRASNAHRDHRWSVDNVAALDVMKLSPLALYALSRYASPNLFEQLPFANGLYFSRPFESAENNCTLVAG